MNTIKGEIAALCVAMLWTLTALFSEQASKRIGSLSVNIVRLSIAFILFTAYSLIFYGKIFPQISNTSLIWLSLSGFIGFFIGDLFLFQAFVLIGSRISMLIMSIAPVCAALLGFLFLDETVSLAIGFAIFLTLSGIAIVILTHNDDGKIQVAYPIRGIFYAFIGALGQAGGIVTSKIGIAGGDPLLATDIRVIAGLLCFLLFSLFMGRLKKVVQSLGNLKAMAYTAGGAVFGPFLGVSLVLYSIKHTYVAITSTLTSIVPILLIPASMVLYKEKVTLIEFLGIVITITGVAILFMF